MRILFLMLFFSHYNLFNQLDLKVDLKQDKQIILNEPTGDVMLGKMNFKIFEKYAYLNLSGYTFKSSHTGEQVVKSWTNPNGKLVIYEVITIKHVDTFYKEPEIIIDSTAKKRSSNTNEKLHIKGDFVFHTYVIKEALKDELIYLRERHRGLCEYWIGKQHFFPHYEAIDLGFPAFDLEEILKITSG